MRKVLVAVIIALLLVTVVSPAAYAKESECCTVRHHWVRPGETLFSIGRLYGVSPWAIASYNHIVNPNHIYAGQVLTIPCSCGGWWPYPYPYPCGTCRYHHTVTWGDNLFRISLHYGVSMWHIARCNGIHNVNYIQLGRTLCIP